MSSRGWVLGLMSVLLLAMSNSDKVSADPQVPCYFIFGDSLVDNGNNNQLSSLARANYLPYGIDFADGPTGRFSNGKTTVDVIGKLSFSFSLWAWLFGPAVLWAKGQVVHKVKGTGWYLALQRSHARCPSLSFLFLHFLIAWWPIKFLLYMVWSTAI